MAKIMKRLLIAILIFVGLFAALCLYSTTQLGNANPISGITNAVTNAVIDQSGIKDKIESALRDNASTIASSTGLSESQVNKAIDDLDIQDWTATDLPSDATVAETYNGNYGGTEATVTTYDDPSYVTVTADDQEVTLSVPESAQQYVSYLQYL
jgi:hypothetical protein